MSWGDFYLLGNMTHLKKMISPAPFLWLCVVKSLYVQHTLAVCVLWQWHFPLTVEGAGYDSQGGQECWFAHCFPEHRCSAHPQAHVSCPGIWSEYSFSSFSASIPHAQKVIKAPPSFTVKVWYVDNMSLHNRKEPHSHKRRVNNTLKIFINVPREEFSWCSELFRSVSLLLHIN